MAKRIMKGVVVSPETLAVDVMTGVGPGGHFLVEDHTLKHFREELWDPGLADRSRHEAWEMNGRRTMGDRVREKVTEILKTHPAPPLDDGVLKELKKLVSAADGRSD